MRGGALLAVTSVALMAFVQTARADDEADAKAILKEAAKAMGGEEALGKLKGMASKGKGTITYAGMEITFTAETTVLLPERQRVSMEMVVNGQTIAFTSTFDGKKLAVKVGNMSMEPDADKLAEAKEQTYATRVMTLLPLKEPGAKVSAMGDAMVGNRAAVGVRVAHKDHRDVRLYFDKETHLLVKAENAVKDDQTGKEVEQEILFTEHKEFGGVKFGTKTSIKRDGKPFVESETTDITFADTYDEGLFEKP